MTSSLRDGRNNPLTAVLIALRNASAALTASELKDLLRAGGVSRADADMAWPRIQRMLRYHDNVMIGGSGQRMTYGWIAKRLDPTPTQALDQLARGQAPAPQRRALVEIVRSALTEPSPVAVSRLEQKEKDAVRALAELAMEVEELATNEASAKAIVHRVRARTKLIALEPIGRAGTATTFDRRRHESIGRPVSDGSTVVVVRPGYIWKGEVLMARAVVQDRS